MPALDALRRPGYVPAVSRSQLLEDPLMSAASEGRAPLRCLVHPPTRTLAAQAPGWGSVRAGLDLVAAGLALLVVSSVAVLVSAWMARGARPSLALQGFGGGGGLLPLLILAL